MIITYLGKEFFKISQGDLTIGVNPVSKKSKEKSSSFGADIALITTHHPDYNGAENLSYGDKVPFVIDGPGDYEIKEIFIKGVLTKTNIDKKDYTNTIYSFVLDGINVVFLGPINSAEIPNESRSELEDADILFVPAGDGIDLKAASKIISSLSPKIIIPMDYSKESLKKFLKEIDDSDTEEMDKLTIKRRDLDGRDKDVIVLKY